MDLVRNPRILTQTKDVHRRKTRGLEFEVDADQIEDTLADAALGPTRRDDPPKGLGTERTRQDTDYHLAATAAVNTAVHQMMRGSASAAIPPEWTPGYVVPESRTITHRLVEGHSKLEAGWNLDPAAVGLVDASFRRAVSQANASEKGKLALQQAYVSAESFFKDMVNSGRNITYDFRPTKPVGAAKAHVVPWLNAMRYEIASRAMDPIWSAVRVTQTAGTSVLIGRMVKAFEKFAETEGLPPENPLRQKVLAEFQGMNDLSKSARESSLRLILSAANMDPDRVHPSELITLQDHNYTVLAESFFFGTQHGYVERLIFDTVIDDQGLRYMFGSDGPGDAPTYAYELERVIVNLPPATKESAEFGGHHGIRVTLPPAPPGYFRGQVLILLRAETEQTDADLRTDAIMVGNVPDEYTFREPVSGAIVTVANLPASFVFFHAGPVQPTMTDDKALNHGAILAEDQQQPNLATRWQISYDLAWLEFWSSGGETLHPIGNRAFYDQMRPYFSSTEAGTGLRVEVVVEHVASPKTIADGRLQRRVMTARWIQVQKYEPEYVAYFATPHSLSSMKSFSLPPHNKSKPPPVVPGRVIHAVQPVDPREISGIFGAQSAIPAGAATTDPATLTTDPATPTTDPVTLTTDPATPTTDPVTSTSAAARSAASVEISLTDIETDFEDNNASA